MPKNTVRQRVAGPEEARRRAAILARYVELDRPSELDDERFAAELGLSCESLARLSATWRAYRDPDLLMGAGRRVRRKDAASNPAVMTADIDMDGVHVTRRRATLRRIRAIQAFLAGDEPREEVVARRLGITPIYFQKLVRLWLLHKRASALPGTRVVVTRTWRKRQGARNRVREILRKIVAESPDGTTVVRIFAQFEKAVLAEGLKPLSIASVYALVSDYRKGGSL